MVGTRSSARLKKAARNTTPISRVGFASPEQPRSASARLTRSRAQQFSPEWPGSSGPGKSPPSATPPPQAIESRTGKGQSPGSQNMSLPARRGAKASSRQGSIASPPSQGPDEEGSEEENHDVISEDDEDEVEVGANMSTDEESEDESPGLDPAVMDEAKDRLLSSATDLFGHLKSDRTKATWTNLLDAYRYVFNIWKSCYTVNANDVFLDPKKVATSLKGFPSASDTSPIISAANLTVLLDTARNFLADSHHRDIFKYLDENFPRCIMPPESVRLKTYEERGTLSMAIKIRVIRWVLEIAADGTLASDVAMELGAALLLGNVSDPQPRLDDLDFDQTQFNGIGEMSFLEERDEGPREQDDENEQDRKLARDQFAESIHAICAHIPQEGSVDLDGMQSEVKKYLDDLALWAEGMFEEVQLTIRIVKANSFKDVAKLSFQDFKDITAHLPADTRAASKAGPANCGKRSREEEDDDPTYAPLVGQDLDEDYFDEEGEQSGLERRETSNYKTAKRRTKGPKPPSGHGGTAPLPPQGSRSAELTVRIRTPLLETPAAANSPFPQHPDPAAAPWNSDEEHAVARRRHSPSPPIVKRKAPRQRFFWKPEEADIIIKLVGEYGCGWNQMEKEAERETLFNPPRTQQNIRDKARNIKIDMIKRDEVLPAGFDEVLLNQRIRLDLIRLGKNPDRREDDVDEDGNPIMTGSEYASNER